MSYIDEVRSYYNENTENEYGRISNRVEFKLTCRIMDRYIKPGESILDIGGGPGIYTHYFAKKGCKVTLFDLSENNVGFAVERANELGVKINALRGDARFVNESIKEKFDHVFIMGPMYHLFDETDRIKCITAGLELLKEDGLMYVSFISMMGGMIYGLRDLPESIVNKEEEVFYNAFVKNESLSAHAFTHAHFIKQSEVLPFMSGFSLEKLHLFGQESISAPNEANIMALPGESFEKWLDLFEKVCEREELLSWSEHLMYIGKKHGGSDYD